MGNLQMYLSAIAKNIGTIIGIVICLIPVIVVLISGIVGYANNDSAFGGASKGYVICAVIITIIVTVITWIQERAFWPGLMTLVITAVVLAIAFWIVVPVCCLLSIILVWIGRGISGIAESARHRKGNSDNPEYVFAGINSSESLSRHNYQQDMLKTEQNTDRIITPSSQSTPNSLGNVTVAVEKNIQIVKEVLRKQEEEKLRREPELQNRDNYRTPHDEEKYENLERKNKELKEQLERSERLRKESERRMQEEAQRMTNEYTRIEQEFLKKEANLNREMEQQRRDNEKRAREREEEYNKRERALNKKAKDLNRETFKEMLGAAQSAEDLKRIYHSLVKATHSDQGGNEELCKIINTVFEEMRKKFE